MVSRMIKPRILAIDFGEKRIGLAVSDPLWFSAQGLETLPNLGKKKVLEGLLKVCQEYDVKEILIGLPMNMNGTLGPKAKEVQELIPLLEGKLAIPVKTWDERLSSRQAQRAMIESGFSREKQKEQSDKLAATLILQNYLESKR